MTVWTDRCDAAIVARRVCDYACLPNIFSADTPGQTVRVGYQMPTARITGLL